MKKILTLLFTVVACSTTTGNTVADGSDNTPSLESTFLNRVKGMYLTQRDAGVVHFTADGETLYDHYHLGADTGYPESAPDADSAKWAAYYLNTVVSDKKAIYTNNTNKATVNFVTDTSGSYTAPDIGGAIVLVSFDKVTPNK